MSVAIGGRDVRWDVRRMRFGRWRFANSIVCTRRVCI
jgi:hypothetical protein